LTSTLTGITIGGKWYSSLDITGTFTDMPLTLISAEITRVILSGSLVRASANKRKGAITFAFALHSFLVTTFVCRVLMN
jgi:hypothetical protein